MSPERVEFDRPLDGVTGTGGRWGRLHLGTLILLHATLEPFHGRVEWKSAAEWERAVVAEMVQSGRWYARLRAVTPDAVICDVPYLVKYCMNKNAINKPIKANNFNTNTKSLKLHNGSTHHDVSRCITSYQKLIFGVCSHRQHRLSASLLRRVELAEKAAMMMDRPGADPAISPASHQGRGVLFVGSRLKEHKLGS